ncbi:MAG: HPr family phosphocarrier protein [Planctomycetota bacterium]
MSGNEFTRELTLVNSHGLHLRPSSKFVSIANEFEAEVFVSVNGMDEGNGKSILALSSQAAEKGSRMRIRTLGPDAKAAIEALAELVKTGFGELTAEGL